MGKYFGTDGIRGLVNAELSSILAIRCGLSAATIMAKASGRRPTALIGRDTRISGYMLEAALSAGLAAGGTNVISLGVLPTPAVAYLTRARGADFGIVISASHNPYADNGIKIFREDGYKLSDDLELEIEALIDDPPTLASYAKTHSDIGRISRDSHRCERDYINYLLNLAEGFPQGIRIGVDCANGAASRTARVLFARLGLDAIVINDEPNGININDNCGSTHLDALRELVLDNSLALGLAFDGDADRLLVIDENGNTIDGDVILALCARDMVSRSIKGADIVVGTVMTNSGFYDFASKYGLTLKTSDVGDRNVLELMKKSESVIGGESSGHTIFLNDATTGDGQLTALKFLGVLARSGVSAGTLAADFVKYPQIIHNIHINNEDKEHIMSSDKLRNALSQAEQEIAGAGRVLVRPSGTEPLLRITVEAENEAKAKSIAEKIAVAIS